MRFPTVFLSILTLAAASPSPVGSLQRRVNKVIRFGTNQQFVMQPSNSPIANLQGIQTYFQGDGNLVIYGGTTTWSSGTAGHNCEGGDTCRLAWQGDGNLVVYINGVAEWASNTAGRGESLTFSSQGYSAEITGVESNGGAPTLWHASDTGNEPDPGAPGPGVCDGASCFSCSDCIVSEE